MVACCLLQAAAAAADRMKPQEIANTLWAWATLRFFPGAARMDALLASAGEGARQAAVLAGCPLASLVCTPLTGMPPPPLLRLSAS